MLWPRGFDAGVDLIALGIAAAATVALFRFNWNVMHVVLACALLGLASKGVT